MEHRDTPTHLICALGTSDYQTAVYTLDGEMYSTQYAPAAVARLCGITAGRVTILATAEAAAAHYDPLQRELATMGLTVQLATANSGISREDLIATLVQLTELVSDGERVVLDVTHGFRHLPLTYLAALTYLTSFKGIILEGVYYGAYEQRELGPDGLTTVPVLDITVLFEVTQWYHAVQSANESGDFRPLQRALERAVRAEKRVTRSRAPLENVMTALNDLAPNLAAGLPIGSGLSARRVLSALSDTDVDSLAPGFARLSLKPFETRVAEWAVPEGARKKAEVSLGVDELRRQLRLIRWYAERANIQEALLLLREWLVSRAVFEAGESNWLGYDNRKRFESALNAAAERARLRHVDHGIGSLWAQISDKRNLLAHADTDDQGSLPSAKAIEKWIDECAAFISIPLDLALPGSDVVLLTPLGLTPGVVFTAACQVRPDQVVIVTSREAESSAGGALTAAGMSKLPSTVRVLDDPFAGIVEAQELVRDLLPKLSEARELVVNLTGGTTAMQLVVEKLAQEADKLGIPVRRIFLIDRRPTEEQKRNPYVLGEVVSLSGPEPVAGVV